MCFTVATIVSNEGKWKEKKRKECHLQEFKTALKRNVSEKDTLLPGILPILQLWCHQNE